MNKDAPSSDPQTGNGQEKNGQEQIKPRIVFSRCLGFESCRYNGQMVRDEFVEELKPFAEVITICPEGDVGMGVPREPVRVVKEGEKLHLYQPATEKDWTKEMEAFCSSAIDGFSGIDGFVLKSRSPTCGFKDVRIYRGYEPSQGHEKGSGFFGGAVMEALPGIPAEDEGRLKNWAIRDHFLTRVYTLARYRTSVSPSASALTDFHGKNKLLFMSIDQNRMRAMGRLLANHGKAAWKDVAREYRRELEELLKTPPRYTNIINTAMHAFGGLSSGLAPEERKYFLNLLEEYRDERIPASVVYTMLKGWAIRFDNRYLLGQTFLSPYPKELTDITDSGKGRDR